MDAESVARVQRRLRALLEEVAALQGRATVVASSLTNRDAGRAIELTNAKTGRVNTLLREEWPMALSVERIASEVGLPESVCMNVLQRLVDAELVFERVDGTTTVFLANL